jgi:hypothetical protein
MAPIDEPTSVRCCNSASGKAGWSWPWVNRRRMGIVMMMRLEPRYSSRVLGVTCMLQIRAGTNFRGSCTCTNGQLPARQREGVLPHRLVLIDVQNCDDALRPASSHNAAKPTRSHNKPQPHPCSTPCRHGAGSKRSRSRLGHRHCCTTVTALQLPAHCRADRLLQNHALPPVPSLHQNGCGETAVPLAASLRPSPVPSPTCQQRGSHTSVALCLPV